MELALIPVAALLLLLSGAGTPMHAQPRGFAAMALMRELLGELPVEGTQNAPSCIAPQPRLRAFQAPVPHGLLPTRLTPLNVPRQALATSSRTQRKLLQTRFGFAEGAYLAQAPPPVGSVPDLG